MSRFSLRVLRSVRGVAVISLEVSLFKHVFVWMDMKEQAFKKKKKKVWIKGYTG